MTKPPCSYSNTGSAPRHFAQKWESWHQIIPRLRPAALLRYDRWPGPGGNYACQSLILPGWPVLRRIRPAKSTMSAWTAISPNRIFGSCVSLPPDAHMFPGLSSGGALRGAARYAAGCISLELEFRAHLGDAGPEPRQPTREKANFPGGAANDDARGTVQD